MVMSISSNQSRKPSEQFYFLKLFVRVYLINIHYIQLYLQDHALIHFFNTTVL